MNIEQGRTRFIDKKVWAIGGGKGGVGKTFLAANISIVLALLGKRVTVVDADLGGANLHSCLGVTRPSYTLTDFIYNHKENIEDVLIQTSIKNLKLISGASGILGAADPREDQKDKYLESIKKIKSDIVVIDVGAGTYNNVIDFFIASDQGILVVGPEATSIENVYSFIKNCVYRKMLKACENNQKVADLIEHAKYPYHGKGIKTVNEFLALLNQEDKTATKICKRVLQNFRPILIVNFVREKNDIQVGYGIKKVVEKYLNIYIDFREYTVDYDEHVVRAMKTIKPLVIEYPKSRVSSCIFDIVINLMGYEGAAIKYAEGKLKKELKLLRKVW
ncbi:MAG: AAA family ATPase [bacterium]